MNALCRILVPTDFSPSSRGALEYAWFLARRVRGAIELLHVRDDRDDHGGTGGAMAMQRALHELDGRAGVELQGRLELGEPSAAIVRVAMTGHFDLIVMGQSARPQQSLSDSISRRVAHAVRCPVIHVRPTLDDGVARDSMRRCDPTAVAVA